MTEMHEVLINENFSWARCRTRRSVQACGMVQQGHEHRADTPPLLSAVAISISYFHKCGNPVAGSNGISTAQDANRASLPPSDCPFGHCAAPHMCGGGGSMLWLYSQRHQQLSPHVISHGLHTAWVASRHCATAGPHTTAHTQRFASP